LKTVKTDAERIGDKSSNNFRCSQLHIRS